jgi:hypothetical protein
MLTIGVISSQDRRFVSDTSMPPLTDELGLQRDNRSDSPGLGRSLPCLIENPFPPLEEVGLGLLERGCRRAMTDEKRKVSIEAMFKSVLVTRLPTTATFNTLDHFGHLH